MLLDADIAHKDTLFSCELLVCADQDFFLLLFDVVIVHMNIS